MILQAQATGRAEFIFGHSVTEILRRNGRVAGPSGHNFWQVHRINKAYRKQKRIIQNDDDFAEVYDVEIWKLKLLLW